MLTLHLYCIDCNLIYMWTFNEILFRALATRSRDIENWQMNVRPEIVTRESIVEVEEKNERMR